MSDLTDRLDAIQTRLRAATPGPWTHDEAFNASFVCAGEGTVADSWVIRMDNRPGRLKDKRDAEFIAQAPTDVAFLLDLARKQQAQLEAVGDLARSLEYLAPGDRDYVGLHAYHAGLIRAALEPKPSSSCDGLRGES